MHTQLLFSSKTMFRLPQAFDPLLKGKMSATTNLKQERVLLAPSGFRPIVGIQNAMIESKHETVLGCLRSSTHCRQFEPGTRFSDVRSSCPSFFVGPVTHPFPQTGMRARAHAHTIPDFSCEEQQQAGARLPNCLLEYQRLWTMQKGWMLTS